MAGFIANTCLYNVDAGHRGILFDQLGEVSCLT